ncbi:DUF4267 domain-containing protein [Streptomyces sp. NPDC057806]|uniref:DUF4267 domain-containing protein n=1 Tax=Streptomyces sp. NPDC057806 TaxID=3346255 RepID=UPI0036B4D930
MTIKRLATVLAVLGGLFLLYAGTSFLVAPQATAEGFGLPTWPQGQGEGEAFLQVKGMRDIGFAGVILVLLLTGQRKALGLAMAAMAVVPVGDMLIVLSEGGPAATAYGVHGLAAAVVALTAGLLLRERSAGA